MPKTTRETIQRFNNRMVHMFPNVLDIESSILFCKVCHCNLNGNKLFSVQQHFRTLKHKSALELPCGDFSKAPPPTTTSTTTALTTQLDYFSSNLCTTFLEANLPLKTVDNPGFQMFLTKYTQKDLPNEMTLRVEYMPVLYEKYIQKLQYKANNKPIWISITESLDSAGGNLVAKLAFGLIEEKQKGSIYLLNIGLLERASASSLAAFFNDSLQILWPKKILYENVYLVVTEAIPYMIRAINSLKILYPNMVYVNCLLQAFHRFLEFIRMHFSHVDSFITICEAIFLKSPHRLHLLRSKYHYLKIPSTTTSRDSVAGAWLNAAIYYSDNFKEITNILEMLSQEDDAECIKQARNLIQNSSLEADFVYLKQNFEYVSEAVTQLEQQNELTTLNEHLATIELARAGIRATKNLKFINKFEQIINANIGLQDLFKINVSHTSCIETTTNEALERSLLYKFVPVVIANTEHLFYANTLLENRTKKIDAKSSRREKCETRSKATQIKEKQIDDISIKRELSPQESTIGSNCELSTTIIKCEIDL